MKSLPRRAQPRPRHYYCWPPEAGGVDAGGVVAGGVVSAGGVAEPEPESIAPPEAGGAVVVSAGGVVVVVELLSGVVVVVVLEPSGVVDVVVLELPPCWPQAARPKVSAKALTPRIAPRRNFVCDVGLVI